MRPAHATATLLALALLSFVLGSVHAFSVLVEPLATRFGASVASVSGIYSLALVAITVMVSIGHRFYARASGAVLAGVLSAASVAGALLAGHGGSLTLVWLGYGVLFGAANGAGYGYALQLSAQVSPGREGLAMGGITAAYAVGATLFPAIYDQALKDGFAWAMTVLALVLGLAGLVAVCLLGWSRARFRAMEHGAEAPEVPTGQIVLLWSAYGAAVLAGLMTMGHAVGIARTLDVNQAMLVAAPMIIAVCNMGGSLTGGWLTDRIHPRLLLTVLPLISAAALSVLALGLPLPVLAALGAIGLIYGAVISAYPAAIARRYGVAAGVPVYGKVFTAWAVAGICGPVLAGAMFDATGSFRVALGVAAALSCASAVLAWSNRR